MEKFTEENMRKFTQGLKKASDIVKMKGSDFIFAPVIGAVPLVDMLNVVDRKFPNDRVVYLPNSSRFVNRDELMKRWYERFYEVNENGFPLSIVCLDEVISGASALKGYKQFESSLQDRALKKAGEIGGGVQEVEDFQRRLRKKIDYAVVGFAEKGHQRNPEFNRLVNRNIAKVVEFDHIPTIDDVAYNPIRLKVGERRQGRDTYLPEVQEFVTTASYLNLLRNIASYVGADPSKVQPGNFGKIEEGLRMCRE